MYNNTMHNRRLSPYGPFRASVLALILAFPVVALAEGNAAKRPFWTQKSSYMEGDWLYAVGVASDAQSEEAGRTLAYENALGEIRNFAQLSDLSGLEIQTQMTFTEPAGKAFSVYRLVRTAYEPLIKLRRKSVDAVEARMRELESAQEVSMQRSAQLLSRLRENEERLRQMSEEYNKISQRIADVTERASALVKAGMTEEELVRLVGQPARKEFSGDRTFMNYGEYWAVLQSGVVACMLSVSDFNGKDSICTRKQLKVTKPFFYNNERDTQMPSRKEPKRR